MNRLMIRLIAAASVLGMVVACGPDSRMHGRAGQTGADQQKSTPFSIDDNSSEPTLLPSSVKSSLPPLPQRPPDLETPADDSVQPQAPDTNFPEVGDQQAQQPAPSQPAPAEPAPAPAPAPAPSQPAPVDPAPATPKPAPSTEPLPVQAAPTPAPAPADPAPQQPKRPRGLQIPIGTQDAAIARAEVHCEGKGDRMCPNEVGMLVVKTHNSTTQCTAFLVGDQYLMTNSHCIPQSLKVDGADCQGSIQVFFPKTDSLPAEHISCERMIRTSKISAGLIGNFGSEIDYSLMKLTHPTSRGSFTVSRAGLDDDMKLAFYSVTPQSSNAVSGLLQAKVCSAKQRALTTPSFTQAESPVGTVSGCAFVPGNSGSPGIDGKRQVRAVLHAIVGPAPGSPLTGSKQHKFNPLAMVSILGCTDLPKEAGALAASPHPDCAKKLSANDLIRQTIANADTQGIAQLARDWRQTAPRELNFSFQRNEDTRSAKPLIAPVITCIQPPSRWSSANTTNGSLNLKFSLPNWGYRLDVDSDYRLTLIPEVLVQQNASLSMSANSRLTSLTVTDATSGSSYSVTNQYPTCK